MHLSLAEWAKATGGEILAGDPGCFVGGVGPGGLAIDTRKLAPGEWFIALAGKENRDGHNYLSAALNSGAEGVIVSDKSAYESQVRSKKPDFPALVVRDTTKALGDAARKLLNKFKPIVIAITGTVGKTSVKENIAHVASSRFPTLKNPHNWNTEIGLPLAVFELTPEHLVAVLECASRGRGQISQLSLIARPDVAAITAIGPGHLSEFGSIIAVAHGKWEIIEGLKGGGVVVAPGESPYTKQFVGETRVVTFGLQNSNDVYPSRISPHQFETELEISTPRGSFSTLIQGTGTGEVLNALCATACCLEIEFEDSEGTDRLTLQDIGDALKSVPGIAGRSELRVRPSGVEVIFDAYNSNPMSLENSLGSLAQRTQFKDGSTVGRRVVILGDMLELGKEERKYHRAAGEHIAELPIDCLITVGDLASLIRESAEKHRETSIPGRHFENVRNCGEALPDLLKPGDLVLIKASRALELERLLEENW